LLTELLHKVGIDVVAYFITQSRLWRKGGFAFSRLSLLVHGVRWFLPWRQGGAGVQQGQRQMLHLASGNWARLTRAEL